MHRLLIVLVALFSFSACASSSAAPATPSVETWPASAHVTDEPLSEASLTNTVARLFPDEIEKKTITLDYGSGGVSDDVLEELRILGITTTAQLVTIIPADYRTKGIGALAASADPTVNIAGLLRDLLIIHDAEGYVTKAWRNTWSASGPQDFPAPAAYGVDLSILQRAGVY